MFFALKICIGRNDGKGLKWTNWQCGYMDIFAMSYGVSVYFTSLTYFNKTGG